jgi:hypothetical protein
MAAVKWMRKAMWIPEPVPSSTKCLIHPTKDEMADYLEAYASHFDLPVQSGVRVDRLTRERHLVDGISAELFLD